MALETSSLKSAAITADYDALVEHLAALRKDVSKLASSLSANIGNGRHSLAHDVSDGMSQAAGYMGRKRHNAVGYMGRKSHDADVRLEGAVAANPYIALAIAVGAGLILGAMTRR